MKPLEKQLIFALHFTFHWIDVQPDKSSPSGSDKNSTGNNTGSDMSVSFDEIGGIITILFWLNEIVINAQLFNHYINNRFAW